MPAIYPFKLTAFRRAIAVETFAAELNQGRNSEVKRNFIPVSQV